MSKTLLVTDDAMIIREMVKDAAQMAGWTILGEATNGQEAIERYSELKPDVMTLDLVMPEYDGLHALRGIIERDPDAKILIISALDQEQVLKEALQIGASDFIVKPFDSQRMVAAIDALYGSRQLVK